MQGLNSINATYDSRASMPKRTHFLLPQKRTCLHCKVPPTLRLPNKQTKHHPTWTSISRTIKKKKTLFVNSTLSLSLHTSSFAHQSSSLLPTCIVSTHYQTPTHEYFVSLTPSRFIHPIASSASHAFSITICEKGKDVVCFVTFDCHPYPLRV